MRTGFAVLLVALTACGQAVETPKADTGWAGPDAGGCIETGLETQGASIAAAAALCCSKACTYRCEGAACPGFCCAPAGGACTSDADCCSSKCDGTRCAKAPARGTCWTGADCESGACSELLACQ